MPIDLEIIRAHEFIRVGAHGHVDLAASKTVLAELARACRKRGIHRALLDLRALRPGPTPVFTSNDLAALVRTFRDVGFVREDRLAVLYFSDPHHRAREFAFISRLRGWNVRAFDDFEAAFAWLALKGTDKAETAFTLAPGAKLIPLRSPASVASGHKGISLKKVSPMKPASTRLLAGPGGENRRPG